jgi:hypothetical protein
MERLMVLGAIWLEKINADGSLGIIVKQNKGILNNNKPEQLEY